MVELSQFNVFKTVFYYSIFIILAPISTFFSVKFVIFEGEAYHMIYNIHLYASRFLGILSTSNVTSNVWSAIAAILVLHVALGMYIYRAYSETSKPKSDKDDKID